MIEYKIIVDEIIKKKLSNFSMHYFHDQGDFETLLLEIGNEINHQDDIPLAFKEVLESYLSSKNINTIVTELHDYYKAMKVDFEVPSFYHENKRKLIPLISIAAMAFISLLVRKFSEDELSLFTQLTHFLIIFPIFGYLYYKLIGHKKNQTQAKADQDYRFRNKLFLKIDKQIQPVYSEESYENRSKVL